MYLIDYYLASKKFYELDVNDQKTIIMGELNNLLKSKLDGKCPKNASIKTMLMLIDDETFNRELFKRMVTLMENIQGLVVEVDVVRNKSVRKTPEFTYNVNGELLNIKLDNNYESLNLVSNTIDSFNNRFKVSMNKKVLR